VKHKRQQFAEDRENIRRIRSGETFTEPVYLPDAGDEPMRGVRAQAGKVANERGHANEERPREAPADDCCSDRSRKRRNDAEQTDVLEVGEMSHRSSQLALTPDEEAALALAYQAGNANAGHRLMALHESEWRGFALSMRGRGLDDEDLLQEARAGFLDGVRRFDRTKADAAGASLVTYVMYWIRRSVWEALAGAPLVRVTKNTHAAVLRGTEQGVVDVERLMAGGMRRSTALAAVTARRKPISLDAPLGVDDDNTLMDRLVSELPGPAEALEAKEVGRCTPELLNRLTPRERFVVEHRLMCEWEDMLGLEEVGAKFGVTRERARQIETIALEKLRDAARALFGQDEALSRPMPDRSHTRRRSPNKSKVAVDTAAAKEEP